MEQVNRRAMGVPKEKLVSEIKLANQAKREVLSERDKKYGSDRVLIGSYMENIALPGLFGFDMNDYYRDPALAMELDLRHKLFWLDNSHDDGVAELSVGAGTMYFDTTLFGLRIHYQKDGVPIFQPHAMAQGIDMSLLEPFDFYQTGEMPMVFRRYNEFKRISEDEYGGEIRVELPPFHRGPLDIAVQIRGYEGFVEDCAEDPGAVHTLIDYIVEERKRYNILAAPYRPAVVGKPTSFVADDWVNAPFLSPAMFDKFAVPAYRRIQENDGEVTGFHTCGVLVPFVKSLLAVFPYMKTLELSGWNDYSYLNQIVNTDIAFALNLVNSFVLCSTAEEHRRKLEEIKRIARYRKVSLNTQAIVKVTGTLDDSILAMNRFHDLAREALAS